MDNYDDDDDNDDDDDGDSAIDDNDSRIGDDTGSASSLLAGGRGAKTLRTMPPLSLSISSSTLSSSDVCSIFLFFFSVG